MREEVNDFPLAALDDPLVLDEYIEKAGTPREGFWSPFVTLAWIVSRRNDYVAAVQAYEVEYHANRGSIHSGAGWIVVGDDAGARFGLTLTDASELLREALESGRVDGGIATDRMGHTRKIEVFEWTKWSCAFVHEGISLLPGLSDFKWPASAVRFAFPVRATSTTTTTPATQLTEEGLTSWATDAQSRSVTIQNARKDAVEQLGRLAPTAYDCRAALKAARLRCGIETKPGRPRGAKSFSSRETKN